tara:strand:+ start:4391 stop:4561 length:171 start_codon:yes stop_codon:yes gene_type:complete
MQEVFSWEIDSYKASILKELIREKRYFFVVNVVDLPELREGKKKLLCRTRYKVYVR